jgi:hypothetical protein
MAILQEARYEGFETREGWLHKATDKLRGKFAREALVIPDKIRFAVAFPSSGARGAVGGECWSDAASAEGYFNIIIRADFDDPVKVLGILCHELVHACLPFNVGHKRPFQDACKRIGLIGPAKSNYPDVVLTAELATIAEELGPMPHGKLDFSALVADKPKKQGTRMLKAACPACGYMVRLTRKWAEIGLPICPADETHGKLECPDLDSPDDEEGGDE